MFKLILRFGIINTACPVQSSYRIADILGGEGNTLCKCYNTFYMYTTHTSQTQVPKRIKIAQKRTIFYQIKTHPPKQQKKPSGGCACLGLWLQVLDCFSQRLAGGVVGQRAGVGRSVPQIQQHQHLLVLRQVQRLGDGFGVEKVQVLSIGYSCSHGSA